MSSKFFFFTIVLVATIFFSETTVAQTSFELPQHVELINKEDYAIYESPVIQAARWLEENDLDQETEKRKEINAFVLKWITGSPSVSVVISEQIQKIYGRNVQLLAVYLASYSRYMLENKNTHDNFKATKAALMSMISVYKKGIAVHKTREMDKLISLTEAGQLDNYIIQKLKVQKD